MSSALLQLETEVKDRLESLPFFAGITVLVEPRKNIVAEIQSRVAKLKTLIAPKVVSADDGHPNVHGTYFDDIRLVVGVFQNPLLKGEDPEPLEICEEIHKALKNWTPASLTNAINPRKPGIEQIADRQLNIFNCNFATRGGFVGALPEVALPVITPEDDGFSFSCATEGAAIFFTFDGSRPSPRNGIFWTGEHQSPAPGVVIKARAFLAGYLDSKTAELQT